MSRPDQPVPQEAVDALQRGDLVAAFRSVRQAGGVNLQAVGRALEAQARQHAAQQANGSGAAKQHGVPPAQSLEAVAGKARLAAQGLAQHVALQRPRPPTVEMGDAPGSLRWMLLVLVLLAAAGWIIVGA